MIKVLKFEAEWCHSCNIMTPIFNSIKEELKDKMEFIRVNVEEEYELTEKYKVKSLPTMIVLDDNDEIINKTIGSISIENLRHILNSLV